jgi:hypothetical protein
VVELAQIDFFKWALEEGKDEAQGPDSLFTCPNHALSCIKEPGSKESQDRVPLRYLVPVAVLLHILPNHPGMFVISQLLPPSTLRNFLSLLHPLLFSDLLLVKIELLIVVAFKVRYVIYEIFQN